MIETKVVATIIIMEIKKVMEEKDIPEIIDLHAEDIVMSMTEDH